MASVQEPFPAAVLPPKPCRKAITTDDMPEAGKFIIPPSSLAKTEKRYLRAVMSGRKCVLLADTLNYDGEPIACKIIKL